MPHVHIGDAIMAIFGGARNIRIGIEAWVLSTPPAMAAKSSSPCPRSN